MGIDYDSRLIVGVQLKEQSINFKSVARSTPPKYGERITSRKRAKPTRDEIEEGEEEYNSFEETLNNWLENHFPKFEIVSVINCIYDTSDYYLAYKMEYRWLGVEWSNALEHFQKVDENEFAHVYQCLTGIANMKPKVYSVAEVN